MDPDLQERLLNSIENDRLVLFCGAGLSMSAPSHVPSAAELAKICRETYAKDYGAAIPEADAQDLERMAEYFSAKALLVPTFINKLLPRGPFLRAPNAGHYAIADFLATGIIDFAVSTNVDALTEAAAEDLGEGQAFVALDAAEANVPRLHRQHIKLHGCLRRKDDETVWCKSQLLKEPLQSRLADLDTWLRAHLVGRDVLFLGFWSDWSYLNEIFEKSVHAIDGGLVVIVNPSEEATLATKAPTLWAWSGNGRSERFLVHQSAAEFLDELRRLKWTNFVNRVLEQGAATYKTLTGVSAPNLTVPLDLNADEVYRLKEDTCGAPANTVSRVKRPTKSLNMAGAVHAGLKINGAAHEGSSYRLDGKRIRILNAQGQLLTSFRSQFQDEPTPFAPADLLICVGAKDDGGVAIDIARGNKNRSTVVRPAVVGEWVTEDQATQFWRPAANVSAS